MRIKLDRHFAEEAVVVEPAKSTGSIEDIVGSKTGMSDVLKDAPIIDQEEIANEQVVTPEDDEKTTASEEKPAETPATEVKPEEGEVKDDGPKLIQIGDVKKTEQEWLEAEKDSQTKTQWLSKLTKVNQIEKFVDGDDEKLQSLALYATGRKELPKDFMEKVDLPETIKLPDQDGVDQEFQTKDLPPEVIDALKQQAVAEMLPNTVKMAEENAELKEKIKVFDEEAQETGIVYVENFVNSNEELKLTPEKDQSFRDNLVEVLKLPDHAEYQKAFRIKTIMDVSTSNGITMEAANKMLFGKANAEKKVTDKIVENQTAGGSHVKPSSENEVVATDTDTFIGSMGDSKAKLVNALFK